MIWPRRHASGTPAVVLPRTDACSECLDDEVAVIQGREALERLLSPVCASLSRAFQVESIASRLCPALLGDGRVAVFALQEHIASEQADELLRRVQMKGYALAQPARYVLDAPLLLALARNELGAAGAGMAPVHSRSALAAAFQELVEWGVRHEASDLHLNLYPARAHSEVKYTIGGRYLAPERFRQMPTGLLTDMLAVVWMDIRGGNGALFDPTTEQQGSLSYSVDGREVSLRWASMAADEGPSVCLRFLVNDPGRAWPGLSELGYLPDQVACIERVMLSEGGAIVFSGVVGSGKSTTLACLAAGLPAHRKLITLEDPVEYRIPKAIQNSLVRSLDADQPLAYAAKLRILKRSAMTDVLLGEIRDAESGLAFMDLASSGVNVYTTVHAASAASVPDRLASEFIGVSRDLLLAPGSLRLIVHQALLPRLCPQCSLPASALLDGARRADGRHCEGGYWARWLDHIATCFRVDPQPLRVRNPEGCAQCRRGGVAPLQGYRGRTVAAELIEPALSPDFLQAVRRQRTAQWLAVHAARLARRGVQAEDVWRTAMDSALLKALHGEVDPRDIEVRFHAFETRRRQVAHRQRCHSSLDGSGVS
ncbi:MAG: ATPase, T2SS/T4P/T4SS family [Castellaniella sp.]